ncbi:MAG: methionine--tRNA ligase subunit beta, partial [Halanaerobium sp.]|nr:methionine--tRNA ligase subunit beta [Halanaerobium sp.]
YSTEALIKRINADLANDLGNLLHRTLTMVEKYFEGRIPEPAIREEVDGDLFAAGQKALEGLKGHMDDLEISVALEELWSFVRRTNKYIDQTQPWILARAEADKSRLQTVLYNLCEAMRKIAIALKPFLTETPTRIWQQLGIEEPLAEQGWENALEAAGLTPGLAVKKGEPLFPRIDLEEYLAGKEKKKEQEEVGTPVEKDEGVKKISFADFQDVELRVAEIIAAEEIAGADKLLKLQISLGAGERQIVAGIAKHYQPAELPGKKVIVVANLEPATIFGTRSEGMLLAASDESGRLVLSTVDGEIQAGSRVK